MTNRAYDEHVGIRDDGSGLMWIKQDIATWDIIVNDYVNTIKPQILLLQERGVMKRGGVVQAGGHCGVYPYLLTEFFDMVFTFEPNALNFHCLVSNCQGQNVIKMNVALGRKTGRVVSTIVNEVNTGMNIVQDAGESQYYIPMIPLDSLGLTDIDMIEFDLEGYEYEALLGAKKTIETNKPVIIVENATAQINKFLAKLGYVEWKKINRLDSIFVLGTDMEKLNDEE